jgi:hypothetical protein
MTQGVGGIWVDPQRWDIRKVYSQRLDLDQDLAPLRVSGSLARSFLVTASGLVVPCIRHLVLLRTGSRQSWICNQICRILANANSVRISDTHGANWRGCGFKHTLERSRERIESGISIIIQSRENKELKLNNFNPSLLPLFLLDTLFCVGACLSFVLGECL